MKHIGASWRAPALLAAAFLLCGLAHATLYGVLFTDGIAQLFCGATVVGWALSVQRRVTDDRLRRTLLWTAFFLLLYSVLQLVRYSLCVDVPDLERHLWYAYYIPMIAVPLCCFFTALCVYRPGETPLPRGCAPLIALAALLGIGFLTNDLHFFAFRFPTGILDDNGDERRGFLYLAYCAWFALFMALTLIVTGRKCRRSV